MKLRDLMTACRYINLIISYPGCKQLDDKELIPTIAANKGDKTLLVIGMDQQHIADVKQTILTHMNEYVIQSHGNWIILHNKLRITFTSIFMPCAVIGMQPDYVYII